jgi:hypothetical protein
VDAAWADERDPNAALLAVDLHGKRTEDARRFSHAVRARDRGGYWPWLAGLLILCSAVGCVDGPLYSMKRMNPYFRSQWKEDRERGVVYEQRKDEMRLVKDQLATMPAEEQSHWSRVVAEVYAKETSPELRREAILTLSQSPHPEAEKALIRACSDKNDKVRLTACKALAGRNSQAAAQMLSTIAQGDKNMSVRLAALDALGSFDTDEVRGLLRRSLDDKSPALQFQATVALQKMTGKDFDGNVESWRQYLDGQAVEEPERSLAERLGESMGLRR